MEEPPYSRKLLAVGGNIPETAAPKPEVCEEHWPSTATTKYPRTRATSAPCARRAFIATDARAVSLRDDVARSDKPANRLQEEKPERSARM